MGQGFAPPANSNLMQSANMLRIQPNTYPNRMQAQHETRTAQAELNTPRQQMNPQQMQQQQMHPQQQMMNPQQQMVNPQQMMTMMNPHQNMSNIGGVQPLLSSLNPYLPQNQQQLSGGLASLPGAAQFGKGIV